MLCKSISAHSRGFLPKTKHLPIPSLLYFAKQCQGTWTGLLSGVPEGPQGQTRAYHGEMVLWCSLWGISLFVPWILSADSPACFCRNTSCYLRSTPPFIPLSHSVYLLYLILRGFGLPPFLMYLKETFVLLMSEMGECCLNLSRSFTLKPYFLSDIQLIASVSLTLFIHLNRKNIQELAIYLGIWKKY